MKIIWRTKNRALCALLAVGLLVPAMPLAALAAEHEHIELTAMPETVQVVADDLLASPPTEAPLAMPNLSVNLESTFETTQTVYVEVVANLATETHVQAWFEDSMGNWYDSIKDGFGPPPAVGFEVGPGYDMTTDFYVFADAAGTYTATLNVHEVGTDTLLDSAMVTVEACETIAQVLDGDAGGRFTTLLTAAGIAGLDGALADPDFGPVTLFAPTNDAFVALQTALGNDAWNALLANPEMLGDVLLYHLLDGEYYAADVLALTEATAFETLLGQDIVIGVAVNGGVEVWINDVALVIETDLMACNGVVHVIDAVLVPESTSTPGVSEYWGQDRYGTALDISREGWDSSNVVILARGDLYPDALTGGSLAGHYDAPILLTHPTQLLASVRSEIIRLGADTVILLGQDQALSAGVFASVNAIDGVTAVRIGGADRYQTADRIAARLINQLGVAFDGEAFVARGDDFPDALASVPIAGAQGMPIFLVHSTHGMYSGTAAMIDKDVDEAIILGQTRAVSAATQARLVTMLGATNVRRIGGVDRYDTAARVATYGVTEKLHTWDMAGIARGELFPDSLTGGALQAKDGSIILLTLPTTVPSYTRITLQTHAMHIHELRIFGGPDAISPTVRAQLKTYAGVN